MQHKRMQPIFASLSKCCTAETNVGHLKIIFHNREVFPCTLCNAGLLGSLCACLCLAMDSALLSTELLMSAVSLNPLFEALSASVDTYVAGERAHGLVDCLYSQGL